MVRLLLLGGLMAGLLLAQLTHCSDGFDSDATGCPKRFGGKCQCGMSNYRSWKPDRPVYVTNCTNSGFTNPDIMEYTPQQTEVLIFNGNRFQTLPWNVLGIWDDHEKLEVIDLTNNGIKEIQGKSFHKVSQVKRLILNHNDLYIVSTMNHPRVFSNFINLEELHLTNAFTEQIDSKWYLTDLKEIWSMSELKKLKKLHLEQNEIWEIKDDDMFCELKDLLDLHLGDNQLSDINFSLDCLERLRYLDLSYNKIRNIKGTTLAKLEKVFGKNNTRSGYDNQVDLHGNPFTCDCQMNPLYDWLRVTPARLANKQEMRCFDGYPDVNAGKRIVNVEKLQCGPVRSVLGEAGGGSHHAITSTLLIILIILTATLLSVVLWINRITVKEKIQPILKNFKTSLQYSTLEKQEEEPPEVQV